MIVDLKGDMTIADVIARYPSTGLVFLQRGRLFRTRPNNLYAIYDPPLTIEEYAALNGLAAGPLLERLRAVAEIDQFARRIPATRHRHTQRATPTRSIGTQPGTASGAPT